MKRTFNLFSIRVALTVACLAWVAMPAKAQYFGGTYGSPKFNLLSTGTNTVAPISTNFTLTPIPIQNAHNLGLSLTVAPAAGASVTGQVSFVKSLDGVLWDTTPFVTLAVTCPGSSWGTSLTYATNIDMGAYGYFSPYQYVSGATVSNLTIQYSIKPGY